MVKNEFVSYLNTLHNYYAQNANVFGEKNIKSDYYKETMVEIPICDFIINQLTNKPSHIIVLTGHAGDGKTSLMYQVLRSFNQNFDTNSKEFEISLNNGRKCLCIKDFSEFSDEQKKVVMKNVSETQKKGDYVFIVANTGPLINSFPEAYTNDLKEDVQSKLIKLLDDNTGEITDLYGLKISVVNIVSVNNTFFPKMYVKKIINNELWSKCNDCDKKNYCPIRNNVELIRKNEVKVLDFITNHYRWLSEYEERLTIRNMTQQISYMITGGLNCEDVIEELPHVYLSSNLFFGYKGTRPDDKALEINAIKCSRNCNYDKKRFRVDEELFINKNYNLLFSKEVCNIISNSEKHVGRTDGWHQMLKRLYMFYNIESNLEKIKNDKVDIFSEQFPRFVELKYENSNPKGNDSSLIQSALLMLNLGKIDHDNYVPFTMSRESGYVQNVQYVIGTVKKNKIKLVTKKSNHSAYLGEESYNDLFIQVEGKVLKRNIDLPLLDYFEDLKNGIINTNIDSQLSKGIENIKSEILSIVNDYDEDKITIIVTNNADSKEITLDISEGKFSKD